MNLLYSNKKTYKIEKNEAKNVLDSNLDQVRLLIFIKQDIDLQNEQKEMLDKLVSALHLKLEEVAYIYFSNSLQFSEYIRYKNIQFVLSFGAEPSHLMLQTEPVKNKIFSLEGIQILLFYNLLDVYTNQSMKSNLWKLIQKFNF